MTKLDLLTESEQNKLREEIFYFHPESYAFYEDGQFLPDVS